MFKISKRQAIAAVGTLAATAVIAIPAAVVYATKDISSKDEIGANVQRELENRILESLNLMPSNQFGTFDTDKILKDKVTLDGLKEDVERAHKEFDIRVKSRMPIYGIINDVLTASERFEDWDTFTKAIQKVLVDITKGDWTALEQDLFDTANDGTHKILSPTYGVKRSDVDTSELISSTDDTDSTVVKNEFKRKNYGLEHSFVSFGEYVDNLKNNKNTGFKKEYIESIESALNMMTGTPIDVSGGITHPKTNIATITPTNSIVYMALFLEDRSNNLYDTIGSVWKNQVLKAWDERYRSIDQFFSVNHQPLGPDGNFNSKVNIDVFKIYDKRFYAEYQGSSLSESLSSFLDGSEMQGKVPVYNIQGVGQIDLTPITDDAFNGISGRYLTNLEFMESLFGDAFEAVDGTKVVTPTSDVPQNGYTWDSVLDAHTSESIDGKAAGGSASTPTIREYFNNAIKNIFVGKESGIYKLVERYDTPGDKTSSLSPTTEKSTTYNFLTQDLDFQDSYQEFLAATETYENEIDKINRDSFRVGINLEKFKEVTDSFGLDKKWYVQIDSLMGKKIDESALQDIKNKLKYQSDKTTLIQHTADYDIDGDFIYPKDFKWLLRSTDSLSIRSLGFTSEAKLKQFEDQMKEARVFKPTLSITKTSSIEDIKPTWETVGTVQTGGSDD